MISGESISTILFMLGLLTAEYLLRSKTRNLVQEFAMISVLIGVAVFIYSKTYYYMKKSEMYLYPYSFLVGFVSTVIARFATFSFGFHKLEFKKKGGLKRILERKLARVVLELKKEGLEDEKIIEICGKVGIGKRFAKSVLKALK